MRSGFFNSNITGYDELGNPIYDRAEEASFFAEFFAAFIGTGVYPNPSTGMQVVENSTLGVLVKPGKCFINGYFGMVEPGGETVVFEIADSNLPRIDRVVARWDLQIRDVILYVLKGVPAVNPVAPELTRNSNVYEIGLADVRIEKNVSVITQANITDTRLNRSLCGIVTGVIEQVDTTSLFNQYLSWFEAMKQQSDMDYQKWFNGFTTPSEVAFKNWFDNLKVQLSGDVAGNLQNEIDDLQELVDKKVNKDGDTLTGILNTKALIPTTDGTDDLGSLSKSYRSAFVKKLNFGNGNSFSFKWSGTQLSIIVDKTTFHIPTSSVNGINFGWTAEGRLAVFVDGRFIGYIAIY